MLGRGEFLFCLLGLDLKHYLHPRYTSSLLPFFLTQLSHLGALEELLLDAPDPSSRKNHLDKKKKPGSCQVLLGLLTQGTEHSGRKRQKPGSLIFPHWIHMLDTPRPAVSATDHLSACTLASHAPSKAPALCLLNCRGAPEVSPSVFPLMPPVCMFDSHSKRKTL